MKLIKDLGMKPNKNGNRYRMGIYECPSCKKVQELCTHNVKRQIKTAEKKQLPAECLNCSLVRRNTKHNKSKTVAYQKYQAMKSRCYNQNFPNFKRWGGRGITVCEEWLNSFENFEKWFNAQNYYDGDELDRIDNNGNYCPENCRLVPKYQNARNRETPASKHSKYRYVVWNKTNNNWVANVPMPNIKGKRKYLGSFKCEEKAQKAIQKYYDSFDNDLKGLIEY